MNKKLILELLEKGRISVDETLALLGETVTTQPPTSKRKKDYMTRTVIGSNQHEAIVSNYKLLGDVARVAKRLHLQEVTVRGHLQYAGLVPAKSERAKHRVRVWRERHRMYLDLPQGRPL
jgi:hypothetical protein